MIINNSDWAKFTVAKLNEKFLDSDRRIKLLPASTWQSIDPIELRLWCHSRAIYSIPTIELIDWLREQIAGKTAIEVGAGNNCLGWHLGIPTTDSYIQQNDPVVRKFYELTRQPITSPHPETQQYEACEAVKRFKPEVVIASWLTEKWNPATENGSDYGTDETWLIQNVEKYIHIGNHKIHGNKTVRDFDHTVYQPDWLVSRASCPDQNAIYVWQFIPKNI